MNRQTPGPLPLVEVYRLLDAAYGAQHWWPAEDPFEVMVGAILTQNTAWGNVERAIANLRANGHLDPRAIVDTPPERLAEWLRPSGYFNIKAARLQHFCRWYLEQGGFEGLGGRETEPLRAALLQVKGVGPETADDILLYAFERPVFVIDTYTRRLFARLGHIQGDEHYERLREYAESALGRGAHNVALFNQYHALIVAHAKQSCRKRPVCEGCCLAPRCPQPRSVGGLEKGAPRAYSGGKGRF